MGAVLGGDDLVEVDRVAGGISRLRPTRPRRAVLVLHARPPDQRDLVREAERLFWLGGREPAPEVLASGRADEGDEAVVIRMPVGAVPATSSDHGFDLAAVADHLAAAIGRVHELDGSAAPPSTPLDELWHDAAHRVSHGLVTQRVDGPYRSQVPERLLAMLDAMLDEIEPADECVIHGCPQLENLWLAPDRSAVLTGWADGGTGDRHRDLAVASRSLVEVFGPAVVAPFLDSYGLDRVDLRRLDAHQLLDHLLT